MKITNKISLFIITFSLLGFGFANAQNILATPTKDNTEKKHSVANVEIKKEIEENKIEADQEKLYSIEKTINQISSITSGETNLAAGAGMASVPGACAGPKAPCLGPGTGTIATTLVEASFTAGMTTMEQALKLLIDNEIPTVTLTQCVLPTSVVQAIDCQKMRIEAAFSEITKKEEAMLNKQKQINRNMIIDQGKAEIAMSLGKDKLGNNCEKAKSKSGAIEIAKKTEEQYKKASNTATSYSNLNKETLQQLSGTKEEFAPNSSGAINARLASSLAFETTGDFPEQKNEEGYSEKTSMPPARFNEDGTPIGVAPLDSLAGVSIFPTVLPAADRNYYGFVLARPVIKTLQHSFAALNGIVNLFNPIPEETNIDNVPSSRSVDFVAAKSKQARFSVAQDISNFSMAFREALNDGKEGTGTYAAKYIKEELENNAAAEEDYADLGNTISEYQFLDSLVRRIPQSTGYYVKLSPDNPTNIDREIIRNLGTTLAIKWKQYQVLEKILANRAATLAVHTEQK
ncbi:MAG: hypothetical protein N4A43_00215 [Alphaproteobacteria bacterium]|jgi:hypothetical protein|nr:hypothetical protein [Alphaproteobacteria bacterium]